MYLTWNIENCQILTSDVSLRRCSLFAVIKKFCNLFSSLKRDPYFIICPEYLITNITPVWSIFNSFYGNDILDEAFQKVSQLDAVGSEEVSFYLELCCRAFTEREREDGREGGRIEGNTSWPITLIIYNNFLFFPEFTLV